VGVPFEFIDRVVSAIRASETVTASALRVIANVLRLSVR